MRNAGNGDIPAMGPGNRPGKAKSQSGAGTGSAGITAKEALKNMRHVHIGYPDSRIFNSNLNRVPTVRLGCNVYIPARRRIFDGIVEQV